MILSPGHRDIKQSFLFQPVEFGTSRLRSFVSVGLKCRPEADLKDAIITPEDVTWMVPRESTKPYKDDDREFQSLRGVCRHDPDSIIVRLRYDSLLNLCAFL